MINGIDIHAAARGGAVRPDCRRHRGSSGIGLETARQAHVVGAGLDFDEALQALDEDLLGPPMSRRSPFI